MSFSKSRCISACQLSLQAYGLEEIELPCRTDYKLGSSYIEYTIRCRESREAN